jgi:DNA-binding NarL/FixJ family response regulator
VARAVGEGKTNADIAGELYMSVATVKAHVTRLLSKLAVQNRVQIALLINDADLYLTSPATYSKRRVGLRSRLATSG